MRIDLPPPPYSPWLRLAHHVAWTRGPGTGQGNRRRLRDWKFLLQTAGDSWLWFGEGRWPLHPGDLALVPPGVEYAWGVPDGSHLAVHFDLHAQPGIIGQETLQIVGGLVDARPARQVPTALVSLDGSLRRCRLIVRPPSPRRWRDRFQPLVRQWLRREHHRPAQRLAAAGILAEAFTEWLTLADADATGPSRAELAVGAIIDRLADGPPPRDLDVPSLAREAGLGVSRLRTVFARVAGEAPRAWLERRRIEHAANLLRDAGLGVAEAAMAVGYDDPFHFARVFRRVTGTTPTQTRVGAQPQVDRQRRPTRDQVPPRRPS